MNTFDPTLPLEGAPLDAAEMRGQLNGLKALIDAVPALTAAQVEAVETLPPGSPAQVGLNVVGGNTLRFTFALPQGAEGLPGAPGMPGPPFAQAVVDAVNTVDPGQPATVGVSFDGANVRFTFDIPRGSDGMNGSHGSDGAPGPPGNEGSQGPPGADGPPGPPFAQAVVDAVNTLDPGQQASVGVSFDGANVRFTFGIPRGSDGLNGSAGAPGPPGNDGIQGPPGEVSQAQLDSAISGTSANTNAVGTLDTAFADPDLEVLRQKLNELILNGRR